MHLRLRAFLAVLLTVTLLAMCFPPFHLGGLAWIALIPAMLVIPRLSIRGAEWFGFLLGFVFYATGFHWFAFIFGFPAVALWGLLALYVAAFIALARSLPERMHPLPRALLLSVFWVALEFIRAEQWPLRFAWLTLGSTQHNQPALQWASWIGVYGLSFLVMLVNAGVSASFNRRAWGSAAAFLALPVFSLTAPFWFRPGQTMDGPGSVVLVQSASTSLSHLRQMTDKARETAGARPLIVWPEYVVQWTPEEDPDLLNTLGDMAKAWDATTVVGGVTGRGGDAFSSAALVTSPDGDYQGAYEKHNPIPLFQDGLPGIEYPLFQWVTGATGVPFGTVICYDMSFEPHVRRLSDRGAEMIVVPSRDDMAWGRIQHLQHSMMAPLRAVENRRSIVRAAESGESQVVGPDGDVLARLSVGVEDVLVYNDVPLSREQTVYQRTGWRIPYVCQFAAVIWVLSRLFERRRRRSSANVDDLSLPVAH